MDRWEGVTCCPKTYPLYDGVKCRPLGAPLGEQAAAVDSTRTMAEPGASWTEATGGCHSGSVTGDPHLDAATCVVVAISLAGNNLRHTPGTSALSPPFDMSSLCAPASGLDYLQVLDLKENPRLGGATADGRRLTLNGVTATCFRRLRILDLTNSRFTGALPVSLLDAGLRTGQLDQLRLRGNELSYPSGTQAELLLRQVVAECKSLGSNVLCEGLPPVSCDAFGPAFRLSASDPSQCIECDPGSFLKAILGVSLISALLLSLIATYIYLVRKYKSSIKAGVATVAILLAHLQTVSIVGYLQLAWPPSVTVITSTMSLSFIDFDFVRPECLAERDVNSFILLSCCQLGVIALGFIVPSFASTCFARLRRRATTAEAKKSFRKKADTAIFVQTIIVTSAFVTTWNLALRLVETMGADDWTYKMGAGFAFFVLCFEAFLITRYLWRLLAFMAGTPSARASFFRADGSEAHQCRGWSWMRVADKSLDECASPSPRPLFPATPAHAALHSKGSPTA